MEEMLLPESNVLGLFQAEIFSLIRETYSAKTGLVLGERIRHCESHFFQPVEPHGYGYEAILLLDT